MSTLAILFIGLSAALAVCVGWLLIERSWQTAAAAAAEARAGELSASLDTERERTVQLVSDAAALDARVRELEIEAATLVEKAAAADRAREDDAEKLKQLREAFDSMAGEALDRSAKRFLELAGQTFEKHREVSNKDGQERREAVEKLIAPIGESLKKTDEHLKKIDTERLAAQAALKERFEADERQRRELADETRRLSDALPKHEVRGRYGEIQLQRVAEVAGMAAYCDFDTQHTVRDTAGTARRPDMVVRLPNDRVIVVDAKANIEHYLRALDTDSANEQESLLERFADGISAQAKDLAKKEYWSQFEQSPEFVVMFVPGDQFVDAALSRRPTMLEDLAQQGVILASPSTLIGLLRAVHIGWRENAISQSARELLTLGHELHERSAVLVEHVASVGKGLSGAVASYNKLVGSVDQRLMPTLRKFEDTGAKSAKTLAAPPEIELTTRPLRAATGASGSEEQAPALKAPARRARTSPSKKP